MLALSACSRREATDTPAAGGAGASAAGTPAAEVRLGYFPNITHAPALIGVANGYFQQELGSTKLTTQTFNAGPEEVSALLGSSLDAGFIGSGPAINAFAKSNGEAVRLVAGSTSGGAQLVVSPDITSPEQLKGKIVATPQAGNTQDIALKKWLKGNNLTNGTGPDAVTVQNIDNPRTLDLFKSGQIAGGWLPEPWSSRLVDAGAKVLVDEKSLWPDGKFPTTVLIVRTQFLNEHPQTVEALLRAEQKAIDFATADQTQAKTVTNDAIKQLTNSSLAPAVIDRAFTELSFGIDPLAATFPQLAKDAVTAGVAETGDEPRRVRRRDAAEQRVDGRGQADGGRRRTRQGSGVTHEMTTTIAPVETERTPALTLRGVAKTFGHGAEAVTALRGIDLHVEPGEFVCLLGASGCGKSTLLNLVAGLDEPTAGDVTLGTARPSFMFQEAALLPWLTARRNVELPLQLAGLGRRERRQRADELLSLVRLKDQGDKRPHELSGGMRQRVSLARALATATSSDEPRTVPACC